MYLTGMCKQSLKNLFVLTLCLTNTLKGILSTISRYLEFIKNEQSISSCDKP